MHVSTRDSLSNVHIIIVFHVIIVLLFDLFSVFAQLGPTGLCQSSSILAAIPLRPSVRVLEVVQELERRRGEGEEEGGVGGREGKRYDGL